MRELWRNRCRRDLDGPLFNGPCTRLEFPWPVATDFIEVAFREGFRMPDGAASPAAETLHKGRSHCETEAQSQFLQLGREFSQRANLPEMSGNPGNISNFWGCRAYQEFESLLARHVVWGVRASGLVGRISATVPRIIEGLPSRKPLWQ